MGKTVSSPQVFFFKKINKIGGLILWAPKANAPILNCFQWEEVPSYTSPAVPQRIFAVETLSVWCRACLQGQQQSQYNVPNRIIITEGVPKLNRK